MSDEHNDEFEKEPIGDEEETPSEEVVTSEEDYSEPPNGHKELLGASESELEVYSLVIAYGNATLGDLALLSKGRSLDQIVTQIDGLKEKNMIVELPGLIPRYHAVPPFDGLAEEVREVSQRIQSMRDELKEQIREASTTVRDALIAMTRENLESVSTQKSSTESAKTSSMQKVRSKTDTWNTLKEATQEKYEGESTDMLSNWKESSSNMIDSSKNDLQSMMSESGIRLK
ncbi:MAG: hypothetical protein KAQ65_07660 [Candidatus Thorarchaeota archaeon]|nr:hypothetical protein [Candidatus Thorarchaeota archaeon]